MQKRDVKDISVGSEIIGHYEEIGGLICGAIILDKDTVALVPPQRTLYRLQQLISNVRYFNFAKHHPPTTPYKDSHGVLYFQGDAFDDISFDSLDLDLVGLTFAKQLNAEAAMRRVLREECNGCSDVLQLYYASAPPERWHRMGWWEYRFGKGYSLV
jgi:hypothetical protein